MVGESTGDNLTGLSRVKPEDVWRPDREPGINPKRQAIYQSLVTNGLSPQLAAESQFGSNTQTNGEIPVLHGISLLPELKLIRDGQLIKLENIETGFQEILCTPKLVSDWGVDPKVITVGAEEYINKGINNELGKNFWLKKILASALYTSDYGIFPVMAERQWIKKPVFPNIAGNYEYENLEAREWSKWMNYCLLIIVSENSLPPSGLANLELIGTGSLTERRVSDNIPFDKFISLLIPKHLQAEAGPIFNSIESCKIKYIPNREAQVSGYKWDNYWVKVPDFQGQLESLLLSDPTQKLWIHGIRLPTNRDILRLEEKL